MKPLYINLNKKTSVNYLRLLLGIVMMGATVYIQFFSAITRFHPYQLILLFLFGVYYAIMGAGLNLMSFMSRSFILVDDEGFRSKTSMFAKKKEVKWSDVKELQINITAIRIKLIDSEFQFEYQFLDEEVVYDLKTSLVHQAKTHQITIV
ncbi:hypothetical protein [Carboxylicivirga sp. M1479]|uniref:hypothetical protein n=1 Tax=Carboxylicivirga sp. M1479 TaxID=2594476 RepID=UPI001178727B|nr:hypothetical protein [Carboxylicivirga sp. M1479]TRX64565.1 hypothetical protein FNN09_17480 [Carboxylicivirga sp. M1479]